MTTTVQNSKQGDRDSGKVGRRKDRRTRVQEQSQVVIRGPQGATILADLLDCSPGGFRISYEGTYLNPGSWIGVCYPWGEVPARIVWTAVTGNVREAGVALHTSCKQLGDRVRSPQSHDAEHVKKLDTAGTGSGPESGGREPPKSTLWRKLP